MLKFVEGKKMALFLVANPHYYDYLHDIRLSADGTCEFNDGGGQVLNYELKGTYHRQDKKDDANKRFIFTLGGDDKNDKNDVTFHAPFIVEDGLFILKQEVVWNQDEKTWPCMIFTQRYVFKEDPHTLFAKHATKDTASEIEAQVNSNLYTWVSGIDKDHLHIYYNYDTLTKKPMNELTPIELAVLK